MDIDTKTIYKRILLKLSGEALQGAENFGINANVLAFLAQEIYKITKIGVQIGIVVGGGNFFRGANLQKIGINRIVGDQIGMLATVMNGLAIYDALHQAKIAACLMSSVSLNGICKNYNWKEAIDFLCKNHVVIFCAGTGNPLFTTDSAACLRGIEIEADIVIKATKVEGVFSADPDSDPSAIMYHEISYREVLEKNLRIMDLSAFMLARDNNLPIRIFNINKLDALLRIVTGKKEGTLITK